MTRRDIDQQQGQSGAATPVIPGCQQANNKQAGDDAPPHEGVIPMLTLDDAQVATVFAGLRLLQRQGCPADLEEVATGCGRFDPPDDDLLDALCERVNAGCSKISNWNVGEEDEGGTDIAPDTRPYTVTHPHATAAIRIEIGTNPFPHRVGDDTWIVNTELAQGRPVVRFYQPGQDEPIGTFEFPATDPTPMEA